MVDTLSIKYVNNTLEIAGGFAPSFLPLSTPINNLSSFHAVFKDEKNHDEKIAVTADEKIRQEEQGLIKPLRT